MKTFYRNVYNMYGSQGKTWIKSLPALINHYSKEWQLTNLKPFNNLSLNYVLEAYQTSSQSKVVLKLSPSHSEIQLESAALEFYDGIGCVKLLNRDIDNSVLLRSYAYHPSLSSMFPEKDDEAVLYAASIMKKLHLRKLATKEHHPSTKDWLSNLISNGIIPEAHINKAQAISKELLGSQEQRVLLHGDLHHDNILSNEQGEWIAIDPKGVIGEPAYEIGAFIRNPIPRLLEENYNPSKIILRRIEIFSEYLGVDKERVKQWSYVQSILAGCWAVEDSASWEQWIDCAELIDKSILGNKSLFVPVTTKVLESSIQCEHIKKYMQYLDLVAEQQIIKHIDDTADSNNSTVLMGSAEHSDNQH